MRMVRSHLCGIKVAREITVFFKKQTLTKINKLWFNKVKKLRKTRMKCRKC